MKIIIPRVEILLPRESEGDSPRDLRSSTLERPTHSHGPSLSPPEPRLVVDPAKLEASIARDDFYFFVQRFWHIVCKEKPVWGWHIKFICDELQKVAERVFKGEAKEYDLVINVPPGTSKSTICSRMFPAWCWTRMASAKHICVSHTYKLALDLALDCRQILESDKWKALFGEIELSSEQNAKENYRNNHGGFRKSFGVDGGVTGSHAHFIIIDDPIKAQSTVSEVEIHTANRFISETLGLRKVDASITVTILIMQRLHHIDPTAFYLDMCKRGGTAVRHIKLPVELRDNPLEEVRPRYLAKFYKDGLLDPVLKSRKVIAAAKAALGNEYAIEGQLYQNPVPRSGGMFKVDRLRIEKPPTHPNNWKRIVRFWDKAGSEPDEKKKRCFTAGVKMGEDRLGRIWILDVIKGQWESAARESRIKLAAQSDAISFKPKRMWFGVEQEPGSGGKESAENTIRNTLKGHIAEAVRPSGSKEDRADAFSTQVNAGNVFIAPGEWNHEYITELQFFGSRARFVDQVDASSGAFEMLTRKRIKLGVF